MQRRPFEPHPGPSDLLSLPLPIYWTVQLLSSYSDLCLKFYEDLVLVKATSKTSGEIARVRKLVWSFALCMCHNTHFATTQLISFSLDISVERQFPAKERLRDGDLS